LGWLADSRGLEPGSTVTPAQMARLFADWVDPGTGSESQSPVSRELASDLLRHW
jgi:hypothetical protein